MKSQSRPLNNFNGFSLIEILMVISIVGILGAVSLTMMNDNINESRFDTTYEELKQIKKALIGDDKIQDQGQKASFGYVGDIGTLPTNAQGLSALIIRPAGVASWSVDSTYKIGTGWNGPYLSGQISVAELEKDAWSNNYIYDSSTNPATITSLGADGLVGGSGLDTDITVSINTSDYMGTFYGHLSQGPYPFAKTAEVELRVPDGNGNRIVKSVSVLSGSGGEFSIANIPLGLRSLIAYVPNKFAPEVTLGPFIVNVHSTQYYLSPDTLRLPSPFDEAVPLCLPSGFISYVPGSVVVSPNRINFNVNVTTNLVIDRMAQSITPDLNLDEITLNGIILDCTGPDYFVPCSLWKGALAVLNPAISMSIGNNQPVQVRYSGQEAGTTDLKLNFFHDQGCEIISINDIPP